MPSLLHQSLGNGWVIAGLFGAFVFFVVAGFAPLDVTNVAWTFVHNDIAAAQTGWTFYRHAPWSAKIALNPTYGMDFGGSIIFSDAVPLMAIVFKGLSPILPDPVQYFGLWVFASFVLQGVFGWLLMSRVTEDPVARILAACLISLTPLYCYRLVSCTHLSLTAHWPILAALCLCLPPYRRRPWLWWGVLLALAAFIHIYTFAMVAALWCADIARRGFAGIREVGTELVVVTGALAVLIWSTGVWAGPAGVFQGGFGWFKMNALSLIDPSGWMSPERRPWSYVLPDIPNWGGDYEGFAFIGLGGLILVAIAIWSLPAVLRQRPLDLGYANAPVALALVGMSMFAMSQNVTIGTVNFWLGWPAPLRSLGELFRSTGRFIWPLYYFLFAAAVFVVSRRLSVRTLKVVLACVVTVQAVDTVPGWLQDSAYLRHRGGDYQTRMASPFWRQAAARYASVRLAPHSNGHQRHLDIATMARANGLVTDAAYLSRTSISASDASRERIERGIATGIWPSDTLFIILEEEVARKASATSDPARNFLVRVDGYIVLAPEWQGCSDCGAVRFQ
jgi:hypothetical protein